MTPDQLCCLPCKRLAAVRSRNVCLQFNDDGWRVRDLGPVHKDPPTAPDTPRGGHVAIVPIDQYRLDKMTSLGNLGRGSVFLIRAS